MRMMIRRRVTKRDIDRELLDSIFVVEAEWKQIQSIIENSLDVMEESKQRLSLAQAKYMFLLREAKYRKLSVLRY